MPTFDVRREEPKTNYTEIVFAPERRSPGSMHVGYKLTPYDNNGFYIRGSCGESVIVVTKEDADNLRKALDKAEELGWLK